ncbi:hypothetical protein [Ligilactobacillus acidipiscis]|uniref:hypothetical protein n=1 Tax=Ligilactobacillus acidipiscis TaxID=89059 RepID=UPI0023F729A9|nr:hypothetical protein [Ligilactobacillus acidipiscis]WEV56686.1 hypothetical protein OZX66_10745 [Ligilactobacillus acidipiscis]
MKIVHNVEVRRMMLECGLTQNELAGLLGVSPARVSQQLSKPLLPQAKEKYLDCLREQYARYKYMLNRENR